MIASFLELGGGFRWCSLQVVFLEQFGGCRAYWRPNLEGQNPDKPFLGFYGFFTRIPYIKFQNFMSTRSGVSSCIFVADNVELPSITKCLWGSILGGQNRAKPFLGFCGF